MYFSTSMYLNTSKVGFALCAAGSSKKPSRCKSGDEASDDVSNASRMESIQTTTGACTAVQTTEGSGALATLSPRSKTSRHSALVATARKRGESSLRCSTTNLIRPLCVFLTPQWYMVSRKFNKFSKSSSWYFSKTVIAAQFGPAFCAVVVSRVMASKKRVKAAVALSSLSLIESFGNLNPKLAMTAHELSNFVSTSALASAT
mmetsp:Transcript_36798/g.104772  ORF Transcript_36798/g.104772 Transcript_36798/m.104772 type:complete len:203 (+) Transcript_36798:431-1039(+)